MATHIALGESHLSIVRLALLREQPDDAGGIQTRAVVNGGVVGGPWEDDSPTSLHAYMCLQRWACETNNYCTQGSMQVCRDCVHWVVHERAT